VNVLKLNWSKRVGEELRSAPHLILRTGTGQYFFPLVECERWTIGREATCEIVLLDPLVSRRQAILMFSPASGFCLIDLGSRNGTVVNGQVIQPMVQLKEGDRLRFGWTELEFHHP
jgi:adenylate cyclase